MDPALTIKQGKTWRRVFEWRAPIEGVDYDPFDPATYNLVDVTGYTARFQVRAETADDEALVDLDDTDGITVGDTDGTFTVVLTDEQTAALDFREAVYELEVESAGGEVTPMAKGTAYLDREVVR